MIVLLFAALLGCAFIVNGFVQQRRLLVMRRTPTTRSDHVASLAATAAGTRCELAGVAVAGAVGALRAPLSDVPCVWFRLRVTEKPKRRLRLFRSSHVPELPRVVCDITPGDGHFVLDDGAGGVRVEFEGAHIAAGSPRVKATEVTRAGAGGPAVGSLAARARAVRLPGAPPPDLRPGVRYHYQEWIVDEGAPTYVLAGARWDDERAEAFLGRPAREPHVIGAGTETQVRRGLRRWVVIGYAVGLPVLVLSLTVLVLGAIGIADGSFFER